MLVSSSSRILPSMSSRTGDLLVTASSRLFAPPDATLISLSAPEARHTLPGIWSTTAQVAYKPVERSPPSAMWFRCEE